MNDKALALAPQSLTEARQYAKDISNSNLVPEAFRGKPEDILVAIQMGADVGLTPMQALQSIAVIRGRPCIWGDAVLGLILGSGQLVDMKEDTTEDIEKTGRATCTMMRKGWTSPITRVFTVEDAKRAKLWGKAGPWVDYPGRMLQLRARSWAARDGFADILRGVQVAEEVRDIPADPMPMPKARPEIKAAEVAIDEQKVTPKKLTPKEVVAVLDEAESKLGYPVGRASWMSSSNPSPEEQMKDGPFITDAQRRMLHACARDIGWKHDELKAWMDKTYKITSTAKIPVNQFEDIIDAIKLAGEPPADLVQEEPGANG